MTVAAILAIAVTGFALAARRLARFSIGPALFFVALGMVATIGWTGSIPEVDAEFLLQVVEITLALILFTDASSIDIAALRREAGLVARLLSIGLLLSIALGTLVAGLLFPDLPIGVLLLIGAAVAPTDAALGQPVVTDLRVPSRIRRLLNAESGLNDGIATPFVVLAIALISAEGTGHGDWVTAALRQALVGTIAGIVLGLLGGTLLIVADRRGWASEGSRQLVVLALAMAAYFSAIALGGNGFIAAFVGGLAFGAASRHAEQGAEVFAEAAGSMLSILVWIVAGAAFVRFLSEAPDLRPLAYAIVSLTVVRMLPVALALVGTGLRRDTVAFIGWFGPRGLATIVFAILGLEAMHDSSIPTELVGATFAWTVLLSVVLHGLSAAPLAAWYGRRIDRREPGIPELADGPGDLEAVATSAR
ncbi:MAG TPA: cation:proton antiporter [Candidatus Limnocylindrales bacterium]|nr:cation:proton antiporter [Candidatus Limnocylindrales bacterium]